MTNTKRFKGTGTNPTSQKDLLARLKHMRLTIEPGGKHTRVMRDGVLVQAIPSTPSCSRSILNTCSDLRKHGIDVKSLTFIEARVATG